MKNLPTLLKEIKADSEMTFLELTIQYASHSSQLVIILKRSGQILEVPVYESDIYRTLKERALKMLAEL